MLTSPSFQSRRRRQRGDDHEEDYVVRAAYEADVAEHPDGLDIGYGPRHQVSGVLTVVDGEAEVLNVAVEPVAEVVDNGLPQGLAEVGLAEGEDASCNADRQDGDDDGHHGVFGDGAAFEDHCDFINGRPEEAREDHICNGGAQHTDECATQPPLVAEGQPGYAKYDFHTSGPIDGRTPSDLYLGPQFAILPTPTGRINDQRGQFRVILFMILRA